MTGRRVIIVYLPSLMLSKPVQRLFQRLPANTLESHLHGFYDKLLNTVFPVHSRFAVFPQYVAPSQLPHESADFVVSYSGTNEDKPVLVLEIKRPSALSKPRIRREAHHQMTNRLEFYRKS